MSSNPRPKSGAVGQRGAPVRLDALVVNHPIRVLVCGRKSVRDSNLITGELDRVNGELGPIVEIAHFGAGGTDAVADAWARARGLPVSLVGHKGKSRTKVVEYDPAHGVRDAKPNLVVAFPGGRDTERVVRAATLAGVEVICVLDPDEVDL